MDEVRFYKKFSEIGDKLDEILRAQKIFQDAFFEAAEKVIQAHAELINNLKGEK